MTPSHAWLNIFGSLVAGVAVLFIVGMAASFISFLLDQRRYRREYLPHWSGRAKPYRPDGWEVGQARTKP